MRLIAAAEAQRFAPKPGDRPVNPRGQEREDVDRGLLERLATRTGGRLGLRAEDPRAGRDRSPGLQGTGTLEGRVVDRDRKPVVGAEVLLDQPGQARLWGGAERPGYETGEDGAFRIENLPEGEVGVRARVPGSESEPARVALHAGSTVTDLELRLPVRDEERAWLRGRVTDPAGNPVALARVLGLGRVVYTDEEGRFELEVDPAGAGVLTVARTGFMERGVAWEGPDELDIRLTWFERGSLRVAGLVLDPAGMPVAGATLYLNEPAGTLRTVRSDARGAFAFPDLPDRLADAGGTPWLNVWTPGYLPHTVERLVVPAEPLLVRVARRVMLHVRVVDADTGSQVPDTSGQLQSRAPTPEGDLAWKDYRTWRGASPGIQKSPADTVRVLVRHDAYEAVTLEIDLTDAGTEHTVTVTLRRKAGD